MRKSTGYLESSSTEEEDSYSYRVEWDDHVSPIEESVSPSADLEHDGPGSEEITGLDNAWDAFNSYRKNMDYRGVRLIRIDDSGNEEVYARK